jgi:hypothetical protein
LNLLNDKTLQRKKWQTIVKTIYSKLNVSGQILLSIKKIDQKPLNSQNINGLVINIVNGVYQVGTAVGIIIYWCSRE